MTYLDAFTDWLEAQNLDQKTIAAYRRAVAAFAAWYRWETGRDFSPETLDARLLHRFSTDPAPYGLRGRGQERPSPATRNKVAAGLRVFCRWAREAGYVAEDLGQNVTFVVGSPKEARALEPEEERRLIRHLNDQVKVASLARSPERHLQALRNRALVGSGLFLGLRAEEAVSLVWEQLVLRAGAAEAKDVMGKYGFVRTIPMPNIARRWFLALKEALLEAGEYQPGGPVFLSQKSGRLSTRALQHLMAGLAAEVQIPDLTFHVLRHTYGTNLVASGVPLPTVARLMGHIRKSGEPNIATTARYTLPRRGELRQAVGALDFEDGSESPRLKE